MSRVVEKYLLSDGPMIPVGTILAVGLDAATAVAIWVEHVFPVDPNMLMLIWTTPTDAAFDRPGTWIGTVITAGAELHVYTSGPI